MAARQLPGLGLYGFWGAGATGWDVENDENLRKTSALVHGSVIDMVATEPVSPSEGDRYIITSGLNADKFALYDNAGWVYYDPIPGLLIWSVAEGVFKNWNGSAWVNFDPSDAGVILGAATLDQIGNVNAIEPADGQVLTWDEASLEWQPKPLVDIVIGDLDAALQDVQDARDEAVAAAANSPEGVLREYGLILDSGFSNQGPKASGEGLLGFSTALPTGWSVVNHATESGLPLNPALDNVIKTTSSTTALIQTYRFDAREGDVFYGDMLVCAMPNTSGTVRGLLVVRFYDYTGAQISAVNLVRHEFTGAGDGTWVRGTGSGDGVAVAPPGTVSASVEPLRSGSGSGTLYMGAPRAHRFNVFETQAYAKLSPKMFGCVGDGEADDGVNLQKAADVAVALGLPLHFRENEIYAADDVDFPEHSVLTGHIRLKAYTELIPRGTKRWLFRVGKRSRFDHIEFMGNNQYGYTRDVVVNTGTNEAPIWTANANFDKGLASQLFIDDHVVGDEISVTDAGEDGSLRVLITGHGQRIGFFRASHYRDGSDVLQERTAVIGAQRPLQINGEYSQDGARRPRDQSDLDDFLPSYVFDPTDLEDENGDPAPVGGPDGIPDAIQDYTGEGYTLWDDHIGVGFFLGGYDIRFFKRAVNLTYCDHFYIGSGVCTGRSITAQISPGENGWLIAGCRYGTFVGQIVEDSAEHAVRLSSDNRRGCRSLTWHGLKVARQGPSAFKVNGGGGAGFSGGLVATGVAASLTRAQDIKVFDMSVEDPFIRPPTGAGKAQHLIRVSHCEGFHLKGLVMSITDKFYGSGKIDPWTGSPYPNDPDGQIFAFSSTQRVTVDGADFVNNCAISCLKVHFISSNDFEAGDLIRDQRNYLIKGIPMNHDLDGGHLAPIRIDVDSGFGNAAVGDIEIVDAYFTTNTPMIDYVNFSATPSGKIWVTGTVRDGATLTHQSGAGYNNTNVSLKMSGSNSVLTGRAIDVL